MYEGIFEHKFTEKFNKFKQQLSDYIANDLEDTIGCLWLDLKGLEEIAQDIYVWHKPAHIGCPECYVTFKLNKEQMEVYVVDFNTSFL